MEILNSLLNILNNKNLNEVLSIITSFFNSAQKNETNGYQQQTSYDFNNSYYNLPNYESTTIQKNTTLEKQTADINSSQNTQNISKNIDFYQIFQILTPFLSQLSQSKINNKNNDISNDTDFDSQILKLTHT